MKDKEQQKRVYQYFWNKRKQELDDPSFLKQTWADSLILNMTVSLMDRRGSCGSVLHTTQDVKKFIKEERSLALEVEKESKGKKCLAKKS